MSITSQDIHTQTAVSPDAALGYARDHGVERWFYDHVVHKRTLQDRIEASSPLKERATETFQNANKAMSWLQTPKHSMAGSTPLAHSVRERGFLAVLSQLDRIAHGIHA